MLFKKSCSFYLDCLFSIVSSHINVIVSSNSAKILPLDFPNHRVILLLLSSKHLSACFELRTLLACVPLLHREFPNALLCYWNVNPWGIKRKFPDHLVIKILHFHCQGPRFDPWSAQVRSCKLHSMVKKKKKSTTTSFNSCDLAH